MAKRQTGASGRMSVEVPQWLPGAHVHVIDAARFGRGQQAERVEVVPHDALDLAV